MMDRDGDVSATVTIEARYVPVPVRLEARESINSERVLLLCLSILVLMLTSTTFTDQGILRVDLLDGREIRGVDRSGKSDPYAVFSLNGNKVFKSQTKKKTIAPEWNEHFEVSVVCSLTSLWTFLMKLINNNSTFDNFFLRSLPE